MSHYKLTITFPCGPTIMTSDTEPVVIRRECATPEQVTKLQQAAIHLGANSVEIKED